ncbi:nucleoside diphosphate kinase regulator [Apirhabdus apintestini]|uniref:nucleoside diphosphate kinase regulator n=1 Tax=Erwinia sp. HR93 TaxID=3094840 RepID=UPI002ADEF01C|nr:nucleoside diphosphate kinase regulator [Erwinia sp. HR93]MEA1064397.1 nucleoside diphosphate kinase regulator [Erwinia sp. HR93]WPM83901.1 nucleoside diphosphate kinase regulator [Enterobacteriaceae bacterium CA-0114]
MPRPKIVISSLDAERLDNLLERPDYANLPAAEALYNELDRAEILSSDAMPHDVVTMNSQVKFRYLHSDETFTRTLVYPAALADSNQQISVLAPIGAALLGLRIGDKIDWQLPGGQNARIEVLALLYQPEAAGEFHR